MSPRVPYSLTVHEDESVPEQITVIGPAGINQIDSTWPEFAEVKRLAMEQDPAAIEQIESAITEAKKLVSLSSRITVNRVKVFLDGDALEGELSARLLALSKQAEADDEREALIRFTERVSLNPSENSRRMLYGFLDRERITILSDGRIILYKGMNKSVAEDGTVSFTPQHNGQVFIQSPGDEGPREAFAQQEGQKVGDVVSMARSVVVDNPNTACHTGLHVATHSFADNFIYSDSRATMEVHVAPEDVVSVPYDGDKLRVCRYEVVGEVEQPYETLLKRDEIDASDVPAEFTPEPDAREWATAEGALATSEGDEAVEPEDGDGYDEDGDYIGDEPTDDELREIEEFEALSESIFLTADEAEEHRAANETPLPGYTQPNIEARRRPGFWKNLLG